MKAQGKNIVVTGGGNGVGRELVLQLLEKGATVFAADINAEALQETAKIAQNNKFLFTYVVDISNKEAVFTFAKNVVEEHGKVDGIINNAGIIQPFIHLNELEMDRIATDIKKNSNIPYNGSSDSNKSNMVLTPTKAAELIIKAMENKKLRTYIGKDCKAMNALYKLSPGFAMSMINKVMSANEH